MTIKITVSYHFTLLEWQQFEGLTTPSVSMEDRTCMQTTGTHSPRVHVYLNYEFHSACGRQYFPKVVIILFFILHALLSLFMVILTCM